jgi:hypothetical protein
VIFDDRKTARITLCILGKSGEVELARDDAEDEDEAEDATDEGRVNRPEYCPRLIVVKGYTATSRGGRCIMKSFGRLDATVEEREA